MKSCVLGFRHAVVVATFRCVFSFFPRFSAERRIRVYVAMVFFNGTWNANYVFKSIQEFILKQLYIVIVAAIQGYIGHEVDSEVHSYHVYFSSLYEASFHVRWSAITVHVYKRIRQ